MAEVVQEAYSGVLVNFNVGGLPRNVLGVAMTTAWRTPALEAVRAQLSASAAPYAHQLKTAAQAIKEPYKQAAISTQIGEKYSAAYGTSIHPGRLSKR
jgi:hypothetical protein